MTPVDLLLLERDAFLGVVLGEDGADAAAVLAPPRDSLDALSRQPLLSHVDRAALADLSRAATVVELDEGAELFRAGQDDDRYCVVMRGEVRLHHATGAWSALPGDAFGEIAVLHHGQRAHGPFRRRAAAARRPRARRARC